MKKRHGEHNSYLIQNHIQNPPVYNDDQKLSTNSSTNKITSGAAQGSILGPELWNITYDEFLKIDMPPDTHLVGYADDIAAVIAERWPHTPNAVGSNPSAAVDCLP